MSAQSYALNESDKVILRQELDLVSVIHHRNKNQHHSATWYRHLKYLKSSLTRITRVVRTEQQNDRRKKKQAGQRQSVPQVQKECEAFLTRVRSMYLSFSQIVGTWQYVPLGMVLIGILARVFQIVRRPREEMQDTKVENVEVDDPVMSKGAYDSDVGEVVARPLSCSGPVADESETHVLQSIVGSLDSMMEIPMNDSSISLPISNSFAPKISREKTNTTQVKKKKKKRKALDEIDKIFA